MREVEEVDVFESGIDGAKAVARRSVREDANLVLPADQVRGDDVKLSLDRAQLVVGATTFDQILPSSAASASPGAPSSSSSPTR